MAYRGFEIVSHVGQLTQCRGVTFYVLTGAGFIRLQIMNVALHMCDARVWR